MKKKKNEPITKEVLIERFLVLKSSEGRAIDLLITRIDKFIAKQPDTDLTLIVCLLKALRADNGRQPYENCCAIAAPIFEILDNTTNWGYLELFVLSAAVVYNEDFNKAAELFQEALDVLDLDEHVSNPKCKPIRTNLHANFTNRINRARYYEADMNVALLRKLFTESYDYAMEFYVRKNLPKQHLLEIRRGISEDNLPMAEAALVALEEKGENKLHSDAKDELMEFVVEMSGELNVKFHKYLHGYQIRKRRIELGMSAGDLADALGWDEPLLTAIERGSDSASIRRLRKIALELKVSLDYFYGDDDMKFEGEFDPFMYSVKAKTTGATDKQKDKILKVISLCMSMND